MATTRIMSIHIARGKTVLQCFRERTGYIMNPNKTDQGELIQTYACTPETLSAEWLLSKRTYQQQTGRHHRSDVIAYQVRQSFKPGEVSPEEANRIGYEFATRFLKGEHAFIVATHIDKHHIHNHIIWNAVSLDSSRKFRDFRRSHRAVSRLSDLICTEHRISVIVDPQGNGMPYPSWMADRKKPTHRDLLRTAIDNALAQKPKSVDELLQILRDSNIEIKQGKHISLRIPGNSRFARLEALGTEYHLDVLLAIIKGQKTHKPHKTSTARKSQDRLRFLINVTQEMREQKGEAYARWAAKINLKQMAKAMLYIDEHGIEEYDDLARRSNKAADLRDSLQVQIKDLESQMNDNAELQRHIINYLKYRKIYQAYKASRYSRTYAKEHEQELGLFKAARTAFDQHGLTKLPKLDELRTAYAALRDQKQSAYAELRRVRAESDDLIKVKQNIDIMLRQMDQEQQPTQEGTVI